MCMTVLFGETSTQDKYFDFLKYPGNLLLSLNTDWFQPFSRTKYSVGVLYLVVLNLPRNQRYKMKNVILCGIIPGPKEPKLTMNSFIAPLVKELDDAYRGWMIPTKHPIIKTVCVRQVLFVIYQLLVLAVISVLERFLQNHLAGSLTFQDTTEVTGWFVRKIITGVCVQTG